MQPRRATLIAILIAIATFVAYWPAVRGGFVWDDDAHVTRPELRSWEGLGRIWTELGATQQYYPLMHSAFWLQWRCWGDWTTGYHLVNIALHALGATLVLLIVRRLIEHTTFNSWWKDFAAALAAAFFALHPVHVESVAWITELKNTLSGALYLGAMLVYLRFDQSQSRRVYLLALALFICGLLTKTVTATLPAALLVVFWWQRGRLSWRRDIHPLLPWFAFGAASGLFTAWVEHNIIGAKGRAFDLTILERFLLSGRVVWFYLWKLAWPVDLVFIYPRWTIDASNWRQWTYPALLGLVLASLVLLAARRTRAPLAAALFFVGSLFPVLGFFNVYPFLFSFVADHFQYLPSLGVIVLTASGCAALGGRLAAPLGTRAARSVMLGLALAALASLGVLTNRQCGIYADVATLYETTIQRNPACWMAHNNLGLVLKDRAKLGTAIDHYRRAITLRPDYPEAHNNLGVALSARGLQDEAIISFREALRLRPANPEALGNLGGALLAAGRAADALQSVQEALRYDPHNAGMLVNLGATLEALNRPHDAAAAYAQAVQLDASRAGLRERIDRLRAAALSPDRAAAAYASMLQRDPTDIPARFGLAVALADLGRTPEAIDNYREVVRLRPDHLEAQNNLGSLLMKGGRAAEAVGPFEAASHLAPNHVGVRMNLASAYAAAGRTEEAIASAEAARESARTVGDAATVAKIETWIQRCRERSGQGGG